MKKHKILLLVHPLLIPPENASQINNREFLDWSTEYDVISTLESLGHDVCVFGVYKNLEQLIIKINEYAPDIVFNLLEEYAGDVNKDYHVVALLEMLNIPYTGCSSKNLMMARDKSLTKKVLTHHKIKTPQFQVIVKDQKNYKISEKLEYPCIVKCLHEEASKGIGQSSVVLSEEKLRQRVEFIHTSIGDDAIVEEFIEGREFFVGVIGGHRPQVLPVWELFFENSENPEKQFYTNRAKFNEEHRKKLGVRTGVAKLSASEEKNIQKMCLKIYQCLGLNGHARIDLRMSKKGVCSVLEVNTNPNIGIHDEFALSAQHKNISYSGLLSKILRSGFQRLG